jgi:hypothetical protein
MEVLAAMLAVAGEDSVRGREVCRISVVGPLELVSL